MLVKLPCEQEKPKADPLWGEQFKKTREKIPGPLTAWKVSASAEEDLIRLSLSPSAEVKIELRDVSFFPEQSELIDYAEPQALKKTDAGFVLELKKSKFFSKWLVRIQGVLLSSEGWGEAHGKPAIRINVKFDRVNSKSKELRK
jgi:DsbC/DsbD-like thiol-disulfide interchange protein